MLHFVLPAFPAKSPNRQKTLGHLPDFGEVLALRRLNQLCQASGEAELTICSDGRVFSDLVLVEDRLVKEYTETILSIIATENLAHLRTFHLEDVFPSLSYNEMRERLVRDYAETLDLIREKVRITAEYRHLFNGIHRFLFEDRLVLFPNRSRNQVREESKKFAYEVIQRSQAWGRLVEERFPDAVRLSIHPQLEGSQKIPIQLLPSKDAWATPWHNVTLFDGKGFSLVKRKVAESLGAELSYANGKYPFYQLHAAEVA